MVHKTVILRTIVANNKTPVKVTVSQWPAAGISLRRPGSPGKILTDANKENHFSLPVSMLSAGKLRPPRKTRHCRIGPACISGNLS
jgi:hypothetical protein